MLSEDVLSRKRDFLSYNAIVGEGDPAGVAEPCCFRRAELWQVRQAGTQREGCSEPSRGGRVLANELAQLPGRTDLLRDRAQDRVFERSHSIGKFTSTAKFAWQIKTVGLLLACVK